MSAPREIKAEHAAMIDRVLGTASEGDEAELARALGRDIAVTSGAGAESSRAELQEFERAAAALDLAFHETSVARDQAPTEALPAELAAALQLTLAAEAARNAGRTSAAETRPTTARSIEIGAADSGIPKRPETPEGNAKAAVRPQRTSTTQLRLMAGAGWLAAAAACLALLLKMPREPETVLDPLGDVARLERDAGTLRAVWQVLDDPLVSTTPVSGEVLWNPDEQHGYMRFSGLAVNDATQEQYQLWIFDATRDEAQPVDGGVFDVVSGEVLIPIDAKLKVEQAAAFAVTLERPGGVVVSSRDRLLLLAEV